MFKLEKYKALVPQIEISAGSKRANLLEVGHRAADALVRNSALRDEIEQAFKRILDNGDSGPLAKLAPTSLLFGVWDSRGTSAKLPRLFLSCIRAYDVDAHHRSAVYIPPLKYIEEGVVAEPADKNEKEKLAEEGLVHVPASWKHGGVEVRGGIRRDSTLSLIGIRHLHTSSVESSMALRRYILGLGLCAMTAPRVHDLLQGCLLVQDAERAVAAHVAHHNGKRDEFTVQHADVLKYVHAATEAFGVVADRIGDNAVKFNADTIKTALSQSKEEKKANKKKGG